MILKLHHFIYVLQYKVNDILSLHRYLPHSVGADSAAACIALLYMLHKAAMVGSMILKLYQSLLAIYPK